MSFSGLASRLLAVSLYSVAATGLLAGLPAYADQRSSALSQTNSDGGARRISHLMESLRDSQTRSWRVRAHLERRSDVSDTAAVQCGLLDYADMSPTDPLCGGLCKPRVRIMRAGRGRRADESFA